MKGDVGEQWTDDAALRCAGLGRMEDTVLHEPRREPLANQFSRRERAELAEQRIVSDIVEGSHDRLPISAMFPIR